MLKCQNCQKMCEEYYCMPDNNTILCEGCWKKGLALMQLHAKRLREIPIEIEQLNYRLYKKLTPDMHDEAKAIIAHKNRLWQEREHIIKSRRPYMGAEFISTSKAKHFETIELPAKKKEAEERMRAEQEAKRKAEEERLKVEQEYRKKEAEERLRKAKEERKKKEAELKPYEECILNEKTISHEDLLKVANETFREEVMLQCMRSSDISVIQALLFNHNITGKIRSAIYAKQEADFTKKMEEIKKTQEEKARQEAARIAKEERDKRIRIIMWLLLGGAIASTLIF